VGAGSSEVEGLGRDSEEIRNRVSSNIYSLIPDIHAVPERRAAALQAVFEKHDSERIDE
jgi:hypothetical protein